MTEEQAQLLVDALLGIEDKLEAQNKLLSKIAAALESRADR